MPKLNLMEWMPEAGPAQPLVAEALGTALLVLAAAGAGSAFGPLGGMVGGPQAALAPGLTVAVLVLLFGPVSQGHFNPALSLGMALAGRLPKARVLPYALAQLSGAVVAGLLLRVLLRSTVLGLNSTQMNPFAALFLEALLAFWLQWVYLSVSRKEVPQLNAALAIGATVAASIFWAGPLSSASMNPARSLGPALAAWEFDKLWVFLLGPPAGTALAAYAWLAYHSMD